MLIRHLLISLNIRTEKKILFRTKKPLEDLFLLVNQEPHAWMSLIYVVNVHEKIPDQIVWFAVKYHLIAILEYFVSCREVSLTAIDEKGDTLLMRYLREKETSARLFMVKYLTDTEIDVSHQSASKETAFSLIDESIKKIAEIHSEDASKRLETEKKLQEILHYLEEKLAAVHSSDSSIASRRNSY